MPRLLQLLLLVSTVSCALTAGAQQEANSEPRPDNGFVELNADQRYEAWVNSHDGAPVQATVSFGRPLADQRVANLLSKHDVAPFAIYMALDGQYGQHATNPDQADEGLIAEARAISVEMKTKQARSLQVRAEAALNTDQSDSKRGNGHLLDINDRRKNALNNLQRGVPIIYAVNVAASEGALRALAEDSGVQSVEPAYVLDERIVLLDPALPDHPSTTAPGRSAGLSDEDIRNELEALANGSE